MTRKSKLVLLLASLVTVGAAVAGCVEDTGDQGQDDTNTGFDDEQDRGEGQRQQQDDQNSDVFDQGGDNNLGDDQNL